MRSGTVDREERVLDLWERAVGLDRWQRDEALLAAGQAPPRGLGARKAAPVALRNALFDGALALKSACPACAAECEFQVDGASLAGELGDQAAERAVTFDWHGLSLSARPPTIDDLHAVSRQANQASAVRVLLARCLVGNFDSGDFDPATADDATIEELGRRIERLDPGAVVSFDLRCPACAHDWSAML